MKALILILSIVMIVPGLAEARKKRKEKIDYSTGIVLVSETLAQSSARKRSQARRDCRQKVMGKLAELENRVSSGEFDDRLEGDYLFACSHIVYEVLTDRSKKSYFLSMDEMWWTKDHIRSSSITVACIPRKLSEMQLIAGSRACIEQPEDHCYEQSFLDRVDAVPKTKFIKDFDPECTIK